MAGIAGRDLASDAIGCVLGIKKALLPFGSRASKSEVPLLSRGLLPAYPNQVNHGTLRQRLNSDGNNGNGSAQHRISAVRYGLCRAIHVHRTGRIISLASILSTNRTCIT